MQRLQNDRQTETLAPGRLVLGSIKENRQGHWSWGETTNLQSIISRSHELCRIKFWNLEPNYKSFRWILIIEFDTWNIMLGCYKKSKQFGTLSVHLAYWFANSDREGFQAANGILFHKYLNTGVYFNWEYNISLSIPY